MENVYIVQIVQMLIHIQYCGTRISFGIIKFYLILSNHLSSLLIEHWVRKVMPNKLSLVHL